MRVLCFCLLSPAQFFKPERFLLEKAFHVGFHIINRKLLKGLRLKQWPPADFANCPTFSYLPTLMPLWSICTIILLQCECSRRWRLWPTYSPWSPPPETPYGNSLHHKALSDSSKYGLTLCLSRANFTSLSSISLTHAAVSLHHSLTLTDKRSRHNGDEADYSWRATWCPQPLVRIHTSLNICCLPAFGLPPQLNPWKEKRLTTALKVGRN